jgi:hypothetical protein
MSVMAIFYWQQLVMAHLPPQHNSPVSVWCVTTLWRLLSKDKIPVQVWLKFHTVPSSMRKVKQQLGISVRAWDEHMYEMKQLSQRKVTQQEAAAYFDAVFNNTNLSMAEQDESIIQFYRNAAMPNQTTPKQTIKLNRMDVPCQSHDHV